MNSINSRGFLIFLTMVFIVGVGVGCNQKVDTGEADVSTTADVDRPDTGDPDTDEPDTDVPIVATPCSAHADCNDDIVCTEDFCEPSTATCFHQPLNWRCEDDGNVCTRSICNNFSGCMEEAQPMDGLDCVTGDACATRAICQTGVCKISEVRDCNDGNECTDDSCNSVSGCQFINNANQCNDGSDYTAGDQCVNGSCKGASEKTCVTQSDCNDGNPCTVLSCINGLCQTNGAACDDGIACTEDTCLPGIGCKNTTKDGGCAEGQLCDANLGCTECSVSSQCDDQNTCTTDVCLDGQCLYNPVDTNGDSTNGDKCDDVDACTLESFCISGVCVGGVDLNCDDGNSCTKDWCDPDPDLGCFSQESVNCNGAASDPQPNSETCNGVDDDGDGQVDESGAEGCTSLYWDGDGDGYGKAGSTCLCAAVSQYVPLVGDCDDTDPSVHENCGADPGANPGGGGGDPNKFCEVRLLNTKYELQGWYTGANCWVDGTNWCVGPTAITVYGSGTIVANAKCNAGEDCNVAGLEWGVGYTGNDCQDGQLQVLQGLFQFSPDCVCNPVCIGPDGMTPTDTLGNPNYLCTVKP